MIATGIAIAKPAVSAEVSCLYDSNSEWPWVDTRVCQVEERPLILNDGGVPVCTDTRADKDGDGWGWENNQSCVIDLTLPKEVSNIPGLTVVQEDLVVFEQDFESASIGQIQPEDLNEHWETPMWHMGILEGRAEIVQDAERGKAMQVKFPAHQFGSDGAVAFLNDLSFGVNFNRNFEELYVSYDVKFSEDFDFVQGGKLPGLCGYNITQEPREGCNTGGGFPTGYDGWSARGMWREDGNLENYMYHADQFYQYGDDEVWDVKPQRGQWHTIQHRVVLNTVGDANGIIEGWFDGVKVLSSDTMLYRKTEDIYINLFYFSTFYGGADQSWAPTSDQYMYYDNFRIATTPLPVSPAAKINQAVEDTQTKQAVQSAPGNVPAAESTLSPQPESVVEHDSSVSTVSTNDLPVQAPTADGGGSNTAEAKAQSESEELIQASLTEPAAQDLTDAASTVLEPAIGAANDLESGGGALFAWWLAVALLCRRRFVGPRA